MATCHIFPFTIFVVSVILLCHCSSFARNNLVGDFSSSIIHPERSNNLATASFSSSIIHRDSPESPLYNPNLTDIERVKASVERSFNRYNYIQWQIDKTVYKPNGAVDIQTWKWGHDGEYILSYYIGTPTVKAYSMIITGSDLPWLQCLPCKPCFFQSSPIFNPLKSSSYAPLGCEDLRCEDAPGRDCDANEHCTYQIKYADTTYSAGDVAIENLMFTDDNRTNTNITLPKMIFGCSHSNKKHEAAGDTTGVIGLNRLPSSFLSQMGYQKFSYCLAVPDTTEKAKTSSLIRFGDAAQISGPATPLVRNQYNPGSYYLTLEGISVNGSRLPIPPDAFTIKPMGKGGVVIDSGTTYTTLNQTAFNIMIKVVRKMIAPVIIEDPLGLFATCYADDRSGFEPPDIVFHFKNVDMTFGRVGAWKYQGLGIYCFAMFPTTGPISIFGTHQQSDLNVGFDLEKDKVAFHAKPCT